jgi:hypothetical protein
MNMSFIAIIISFCVGIGTGMYIMSKLSKPELDTDKCVEYLTSKEYTVHLRSPK